MEPYIFDAKENLRLFREMLTCDPAIYSWTYDAAGELLDTNCGELVLDKMFTATGCKAYMTDYARTETAPLVLSAPLGVMWCAVFSRIEDVMLRCHVIGPVFNTEISPAGIRRAIERYDIPMDWRTGFTGLLKSLPVISSTLFFQYGIMLHYCAAGERLTRSDIRFQEAEPQPKGGGAYTPAEDRRRIYMAEQAILQYVREGNLNYQGVLEQGNLLSNGVRISMDNPIDQVRLSLTVFTSLCCRAAIEGGLSPDVAYDLGDRYIKDTVRCGTVSELRILSHNMYEDFIRRVRKCREAASLSRQVRSCRDYIDMHPEEPLSLKILAERVGYNEYYLSRRFKEETGVSVSDYIRSVRVERAKILLASTDLTVGEIAGRLCFSSSSHFSDTFRRLTGMLPQAYRQERMRI